MTAAIDDPRTLAELRTRERRENFPVALRVLPRQARGDLRAVYDYARLVDFAGDEAPGDRLGLLDALRADVARIYRGTPEHEVLRRLQPTVRRLAIPRAPLDRLIEANRMDQRVTRYATFEQLLAYCQLSANPVGELVLRVMEVASPRRVALSNDVCAALQLVEHLQDTSEDMAAGRIYLPAEDMSRFGVAECHLRAAACDDRLPALIAYECARALGLLRSGLELVRTLSGWRRIAIAGYVAGGVAACRRLQSLGYEVRTPARRTPSAAAIAWAAAPLLFGGER